MKVYHCFLIVVCLLVLQAEAWRRRRRSTCATQPRLRDKWHFLDQSKRVFIRIRAHQIVYKHGNAKVIKYRCVENKGNIYLLRKRRYKDKEDGVLCLGFSYIADHPRAEYAVLRLMGPGDGSGLLSPVIKHKDAKISIEKTCDLEGKFSQGQPSYTTNAFIRRALPGCKFPSLIQGRWNFTYQHAKMLEIWQRNATLHLMNGQSIKFHCDKRDGGVFVFRAADYVSKLEGGTLRMPISSCQNYPCPIPNCPMSINRAKEFVSPEEDAIMCAEFTAMPDDPFYSFQMSRHNSGNLLDGQLKSVSKSRPIYVHMDCDWIGSPARPEFLYP